MRINKKIRLWEDRITQQPFNYYLLIGLLVIGVFFKLDYFDSGFEECIFEVRNILFSVTSIVLVLLSFFSKNRTAKLAFISLELLFWTAKLFLFKDGYLFSGMAYPHISLYDTATLTLRLFIVKSLLKANIKQIYIFIITIIAMFVKIYIFPFPYSFYVQQEKLQLESENTKNFLTKGEWIENNNTTEKIRVVFFPENAIVFNLQNEDSLFFVSQFYTKEYVFLSFWEENQTKYNVCFFEFQKKGEDTLDVNFKYNDEDYKTQMIRIIGSR